MKRLVEKKSNQVLKNMQKSVISSTLNITRTFKTFLYNKRFVVESIIARDVFRDIVIVLNF